jgi:hypothetical protein
MNKTVLIIVGIAVVLGGLWYSGVFESKQGSSPETPVIEQSKPEEPATTGEATEVVEPAAAPETQATSPETPTAPETAGGNTPEQTGAPIQEGGTAEAPAPK